MAKKKTGSDPMRLLFLVWNRNRNKSWDRLNSTMQLAVRLAILAEMEFGLRDWILMNKRFRPEYWRYTEGMYALAVEVGNLSAARSIEEHQHRPPYICNMHLGKRSKDRLYVGARFRWQGEIATVTSFSDGELIACTHKIGDYPRKIKRRYRITVADLKADRAARKAARAAATPGKGA